jgi:predicted nicotinamide N-methyase
MGITRPIRQKQGGFLTGRSNRCGIPATAMDDAGRRAFVLANTALVPVPHVPEISLRVAHEAIALWQRTEEELAAIGLPPPFWAFAWAGGQGLARYVLDNPALVAGKSVLDFASGSGLVAIAAAKAGAAAVLAADIDAFAVAAIAVNAEANGTSVATTGRDLLEEAGEPGRLAERFDVILAGDICYEQGLAARVIDWLSAECARGAHVLIGDPGRAYLPKARLVELASYAVPVVGALEDGEIKRPGVWGFAGRRKECKAFCR